MDEDNFIVCVCVVSYRGLVCTTSAPFLLLLCLLATIQVVGSAIAFRLLFGWPLWVGCVVTGLDSFTFLAVYNCGRGVFEALIAALIAIIAACFFANFATTYCSSLNEAQAAD